ncbi:MAG: metal-dependent transcriptional regulator [Bacteroidetes bacterium]|nr:MAG: metal-dependent transcriptional regulator [Bacteroidota bacterium]REJ99810.1 MAG: metal-dependent transcriptional regulator [Bacteroidota bacterium]REK34183.1 MAG: metal-dependent transcriptional regulator [Bacteroidota bacterium]REK50513.1 MAG: metal-dependent transcriptional regulator [Bacteroidota bacterium]
MHSHTEENYLKALFLLSQENGKVTVLSLSRHLNNKMPSVNSMMKKLAEKKLVKYKSYQPLELTEKGKKEAALILRKHRLTEMYLVEKMGFGWENVHEIAEQVEHIQSKAFFDKMDEILGFPKFDPHGSPIPDKNGIIEWYNYTHLNDCISGENVVLMAVTHTSDEFLKYLNKVNLNLGTQIKILEREDFDQSMKLILNSGTEITLSAAASRNLLVKKQNSRQK